MAAIPRTAFQKKLDRRKLQGHIFYALCLIAIVIALAMLGALAELGVVDDRLGIEENEVRPSAFSNDPTINESHVFGREAGHSVDRLLEREDTLLTHVMAQQPGERAGAAWLCLALGQRRH